MPNHSESAQFWNHRYREQKLPWDYGGVPPDLESFLRKQPHTNANVLIPGCGSGYEIVAFREAGYKVHAIELSEAAIIHANAIIGHDSQCIRQGDFFSLDFPAGHFDIVYERTFHCALPPHRRSDYIRRMHNLIRPDGLLLGLFLYGHESEPPPYPMPPQMLKSAFFPLFSLQTTRPSKDPIPMHKNKEHWQIWQKSAR